MAKVLLINPSYRETYKNTKARLGVPFYPVLGLAMIAPAVRRAGHSVVIRDYCFEDYNVQDVIDEVKRQKPDFVGLTGTTPLFSQVTRIAKAIKELDPRMVTVGGGPHCSALPELSLEEAELDFVCYGEGDFSFAEIVDGKTPKDISGICFRNGEAIVKTPPRQWIDNLDTLPYPAWDLFDHEKYYKFFSRLIARRHPVAFFETTRGCVFKCNFCGSKNTVGRTFRKKSVERVIDEIKYNIKLGFRELYIVDDIFTSDIQRAKRICEAIIRNNLNIPWTCTNGIRVDSADPELFSLMKRAGCYKVAFGFESGNNEVLKSFGKGGRATIEQAVRAVKMAREAKLDVFGFFMVGLLQDTEQTMQETVEFGRRLKTDIMKISISIPFPGTPMYEELEANNLLYDFDWDKYNVYNPRQMYRHPNLSWEIIERYYRLAYKRMITMNPGFYLRRLKRGVKTGEFFYDVYYFLQFLLAGGKF